MTRHFIGPLTPSQQRARLRAREHYRLISSMMDACNHTFRQAIDAVRRERYRGFL